ncbi:MAG: FecR domain-containing protein [Bdellovibrionales bacterium]
MLRIDMRHVILVLITFFLLSASVSRGADGVFMVVKGDVKVQSKGKLAPAKVGSKVFPADKIIAGKDSRAKVVMSDKNILNISPDTQLVVEKYVYDQAKDKKEVSLNVLYGKVRATVNQKYDGDKNKFQVKTPSAVAGVRGTDFLTSYSQSTGASKIVTFEGSVQMGSGVDANGNISNPVMVNPGQFSVASTNGTSPTPPAAVPPAELKAMNQETKAETASGERAVAGESQSGENKKDNKENKDNKSEKSEGKADKEKSEGKSDKEKSEKSDGKSDTKSTKTEGKGDAKGEAKNDAKPGGKPVVKAEGKGEAKAEPKAEPKAEAKSETKSDTKSTDARGPEPKGGGDKTAGSDPKANPEGGRAPAATGPGPGPGGPAPAPGGGPAPMGPGMNGPPMPPPSMLGDMSKELPPEMPPMIMPPEPPPTLGEIYKPPELSPDLIQQKTNLIININVPQ